MYKLAIALVVPSLFESMCLPIGEAFYFGLPVACSNVCGLPEQLGEAALFFNPLDIEDMAEKILTVWTREDTRKTLVERGYAKAKEMTPEVFSQRWREVIEEALARMQEDGRWL